MPCACGGTTPSSRRCSGSVRRPRHGSSSGQARYYYYFAPSVLASCPLPSSATRRAAQRELLQLELRRSDVSIAPFCLSAAGAQPGRRALPRGQQRALPFDLAQQLAGRSALDVGEPRGQLHLRGRGAPAAAQGRPPSCCWRRTKQAHRANCEQMIADPASNSGAIILMRHNVPALTHRRRPHSVVGASEPSSSLLVAAPSGRRHVSVAMAGDDADRLRPPTNNGRAVPRRLVGE